MTQTQVVHRSCPQCTQCQYDQFILRQFDITQYYSEGYLKLCNKLEYRLYCYDSKQNPLQTIEVSHSTYSDNGRIEIYSLNNFEFDHLHTLILTKRYDLKQNFLHAHVYLPHYKDNMGFQRPPTYIVNLLPKIKQIVIRDTSADNFIKYIQNDTFKYLSHAYLILENVDYTKQQLAFLYSYFGNNIRIINTNQKNCQSQYCTMNQNSTFKIRYEKHINNAKLLQSNTPVTQSPEISNKQNQ